MSATAVHERIAALAVVRLRGGEHIVDLGAGRGATLAVLDRTRPGVRLTAVDKSAPALAKLAADLPSVQVIERDLVEPLPFGDNEIDVVVSHNMLECLRQPEILLAEIARVLKPHGAAVLGHTDFETLVVVTADRDLSRRVLLTYAELAIPYSNMASTDAQMGRRLAGLVRRSPLRLTTVEAHTTVLGDVAAARAHRLDEVAEAARRNAARGVGHVSIAEIDTWVRQLDDAEATRDFLFAETDFFVVGTAS